MKLPWISREHHEEVIRAKDDYAASLAIQLAYLKQKLDRPPDPIAVTVKLPDDFAIIQPAFVRSHRKKESTDTGVPEKAQEELEPIDWANVNENDNDAIARIAAREIGSTTNAYVLSIVVGRIKKHIRDAKIAKLRAATQSGKIQTEVPAHVTALIENAERV